MIRVCTYVRTNRALWWWTVWPALASCGCWSARKRHIFQVQIPCKVLATLDINGNYRSNEPRKSVLQFNALSTGLQASSYISTVVRSRFVNTSRNLNQNSYLNWILGSAHLIQRLTNWARWYITSKFPALNISRFRTRWIAWVAHVTSAPPNRSELL